MRFEFATATRIIFGSGALAEVAPEVGTPVRCVLVVTGPSPERAAPLVDDLSGRGARVKTFSLSGEPSVDIVAEGTHLAREAECGTIIGLGGGSVLDAGKAIAALLTNGGHPLDYLEVVGRGLKLTRPSATYIAIPTTAGTGTEVTRNAVLTAPEQHVKASLRSPHMLPTLAVVDPCLTYSTPPSVTASTGLDALTQLIEPYVGPRANPMTDALCIEGMGRAARSLRKAYRDGSDAAAREDMSVASLFSGLALANAGLGAVHGFAAPIGGMFAAPHGAVCARLLPFVMSANVEALKARQPESPAIPRYEKIAQTLTGDPSARAPDGVAWVRSLCADLDVPPLSSYGLDTGSIPTVVTAARQASSMKGNPVTLTEDELSAILEAAI